jgi:hypothetical protein
VLSLCVLITLTKHRRETDDNIPFKNFPYRGGHEEVQSWMEGERLEILKK